MASDTYTELYYHFIWITKRREAFITQAVEEQLYRYIREKCNEVGAIVLALNGMQDHIHLACRLPATVSVSEFVKTVKGSSAHFVNHLGGSSGPLAWQPGYGALTFAKRDLPMIAKYIEHQKEHHAESRLIAKLEQVGVP